MCVAFWFWSGFGAAVLCFSGLLLLFVWGLFSLFCSAPEAVSSIGQLCLWLFVCACLGKSLAFCFWTFGPLSVVVCVCWVFPVLYIILL